MLLYCKNVQKFQKLNLKGNVKTFLCTWIGGYKAITENVVARNIKVGLRAHDTSIKQKMY